MVRDRDTETNDAMQRMRMRVMIHKNKIVGARKRCMWHPIGTIGRHLDVISLSISSMHWYGYILF